jgi:SAM-dependent methyltransferase
MATSVPDDSHDTVEAGPAGPRFHEGRPADLRESTPWHPLSHITRELPAALERLSRELRVPSGGRVLDYGCAEMPYRRFFGPDVDFVGADLPGNPWATVRLRPDGTLPVEDAGFDAVLSSQVLEHVTDPATYLRECLRVLRPGGRLLLSTHGIMVYHPDPDDYWRWTCAGLRRAVEDAGLRIVHFEGIMGPAASGLQLVQEAIYHRRSRWARNIIAVAMQSLIKLADRLEPRASKDLNALVFAIVAEKP